MRCLRSRFDRHDLVSLGRWLSAISFACATASSVAHAEGPSDTELSRELFVQGSDLVGKNDWEGARDRYRRSLALRPAAITLYSLALAEEHLGLLVEARSHYSAFVAEPEEPFTKAYRGHAYAALASLETRIAHVHVFVLPGGLEGQEIRIDGAAIGAFGDRDVNPGAHTIEVTAAHHAPTSSVFQVKEGEVAGVVLHLQPLPVDPPGPPPSIAAAKTLATTAPSHIVPAILIGAGSVLFATGVTVGILGIVAASDAATNDGEEASAARVKLVVGDVIGGLGLATAGIGTFLLLTPPLGDTHAERRVRIAPWIGLGMAGVSGTF